MKAFIRKKILASLLLALSFNSYALTLAVQPLDNVNAAELVKVMTATAAKLEALLNEPFEVYYTDSWQEFSEGLLAGNFDVLYADPHVAAYSVSVISRLHMDIFMKTDLRSQYHVVVPQGSNKKFFNISKLCAMPSPRLSNVLVYREFTNPVTQPQIIESRLGKGGDILTNLQKSKCDAAVISSDALANADKLKFKSIFQTPNILGKAFSLSPRITYQNREVLRNSASKKTNILSNFISFIENGKTVELQPSDNAEYAPYNILPGVIWGW